MDGWVDNIASCQFIFPISIVVSKLSAHRKIYMLPKVSREKGGRGFTTTWLMEPRPSIHGCFVKAPGRLSSEHERYLGVKFGGPGVFRDLLEYRK